MLQTRKITRTILASMLAVMVAVSFYPATAFADTDYEAAYNQAKANTQAAYDAWQTAVNDANNLLPAVDEAEAAKTAAEDAVEPAKQAMDKAHRILDYKTRQAMDTLAQQAWSKDYGTTISNASWYYNTDARMQAVLYDAYGKVSWHNGGRKEIEKFKANTVPQNNVPKYGITTTNAGNDDTNSLNSYAKYVYYNETYDRLMLALDYFNEHNSIRNYYKNDSYFEGNINTLVSPYLMVQSAVNAPINNISHSIIASSGAHNCVQTLASTWGDVNSVPNHNGDDPFSGLFYSERASAGGHYQAILMKQTHAGMACSWTSTGRVFEQDIINTPNATGFTVNDYRSKINNYVAKELTAYRNAVNAYDQANANVTSTADAYDAAYAAWWKADRDAQKKKQAYNDAVAAEQSAYDDYMNWLNNQNNNSNDGNETPSQPTVPEPTEPDPTEPSVVTPSKVTGLTLTETTQSNQPAIKVSWNPATNAVKYKLYQRKANGTWGFRTATSTSTTLTYLAKGTTYEVKVAGISSDGTEGPVSDVKALTTAAPTQPAGTTPSTNPDPVEVDKVTGVSLKETNITSTGSHIVITWNKTSGASKYIVKYTFDAGGFSPADTYITTTSYTFTKAKPGKTYSFKVIPYSSDGTEGTTSDIVKITTTVPTINDEAGNDAPSAGTSTQDVADKPTTTPAAKPAPTVGTPSVGKMKVTKKKKTVDIWFNGASHAKSYKVEIKRIYRLKGKKKIAVSSGWKAYNVSSPYKTTWKYKKKVSAKQARKYQGKSNYLLKKSGKKYKLYQKTSVAPVTATKLTRKSVYQVRVTAYNGSAHQTSSIGTFTIK